MEYHEPEYFKDKVGQWFLVETMNDWYQVAQLVADDNQHLWFHLSYCYGKVTTYRCLLIRELTGKRVTDETTKIGGTIQEMYCLPPYAIGVRWDKQPKESSLYFWKDCNLLLWPPFN